MPKKGKTVHCDKCNTEFHEDKALEYPGKVYVHKGQVLCEDCLVNLGVMPDTADTYSVYMKMQTDLGKTGTGGV